MPQLDLGRHSSSSSDDFEVYSNHEASPKALSTRSSQDSHRNPRSDLNDSEEAFEVGRPTHTRHRSGSVHSTTIEEPFTRGEHVFMIGSAVLVASLTVAAVTVVLSKADF